MTFFAMDNLGSNTKRNQKLVDEPPTTDWATSRAPRQQRLGELGLKKIT